MEEDTRLVFLINKLQRLDLSTGQILRKKESMLRYLPKEGGTDEETIRRGM
ncbi:MAG: hypothetical protein K0R52_1449, partial [Alphaproteobacteria bacterium]|nr:hypothetical protein [Alphaproteobacteria bacterium]